MLQPKPNSTPQSLVAISSPLQEKLTGSSISSDLYLTGSKVYVDAAWKPTTTNRSPSAGIGAYLNWQENGKSMDVFLQAEAKKVDSPLVAEAKGLQLAAKLAGSLQLHSVLFFTDNQTLAKAAASSFLHHQLIPWKIRSQVAQFQSSVDCLDAKVYHIGRDLNGIAHNCAHQAKRAFSSPPTSSCRNEAHSSASCPVLRAAAALNDHDYVINSVLCF